MTPMIKPKEKAKQLVQFNYDLIDFHLVGMPELKWRIAKEISMKTVDEILNSIVRNQINIGTYSFWAEVKLALFAL